MKTALKALGFTIVALAILHVSVITTVVIVDVIGADVEYGVTVAQIDMAEESRASDAG